MYTYGVASTSRLLKITGFFCKRDLSKRRYSVKETYNLKEPTDRSHPIIWRPELWPLKYGAASVSRIDKIIGLFYKRDLYNRLYSAKETHNLIDPTGRSHPIVLYLPYFGSHCIDGSIFWLTLHLCLCHILCHVNFLFLDLPYFASAIFGAHTAIYIQGGEDSQDPVSCRSFSTKEPLNVGHFCGTWPTKIRDPMRLRHPVLHLPYFIFEIWNTYACTHYCHILAHTAYMATYDKYERWQISFSRASDDVYTPSALSCCSTALAYI